MANLVYFASAVGPFIGRRYFLLSTHSRIMHRLHRHRDRRFYGLGCIARPGLVACVAYINLIITF